MSNTRPRPFRLIHSGRAHAVAGTIDAELDPQHPDCADDILDLPAPAYFPRARRKTVPVLRD